MVDQTPERPLTEEEYDAAQAIKEQVAQLDNSDSFDASDPNDRLVTISFDGTWNDRDKNQDYEDQGEGGYYNTNADIIESVVPGDEVALATVHSQLRSIALVKK